MVKEWSGTEHQSTAPEISLCKCYLNSCDKSAAKPHYVHSRNAGELQDMPL